MHLALESSRAGLSSVEIPINPASGWNRARGWRASVTVPIEQFQQSVRKNFGVTICLVVGLLSTLTVFADAAPGIRETDWTASEARLPQG